MLYNKYDSIPPPQKKIYIVSQLSPCAAESRTLPIFKEGWHQKKLNSRLILDTALILSHVQGKYMYCICNHRDWFFSLLE